MSVAFNPIDIHVGRRIRMRRNILGVSQEKLADSLGVTFQQVQKYERGANRISASRLYQLSQTLGVAIPFFFEDYSAAYSVGGVSGGSDALGETEASFYEADPMKSDETLKLVNLYYRLDDDARAKLLSFIEQLVQPQRKASEPRKESA